MKRIPLFGEGKGKSKKEEHRLSTKKESEEIEKLKQCAKESERFTNDVINVSGEICLPGSPTRSLWMTWNLGDSKMN